VYPYESNGSFVLVFMHNNPMNQLNDEAVPAYSQICKQAESRPACWFSIDLGAIDPFRLARILGKSDFESDISCGLQMSLYFHKLRLKPLRFWWVGEIWRGIGGLVGLLNPLHAQHKTNITELSRLAV
jgi:hypothetical protein